MTVIVSSVPVASSISISVRAAGTAITTRITTGITVQIISALVLCTSFVSGTAPADLRKLTSE